MSKQYCAGCGEYMPRNLDDSRNTCCNSVGYWWPEPPLPADRWWPTITFGKFTFFPSVKWDYRIKPIKPRE